MSNERTEGIRSWQFNLCSKLKIKTANQCVECCAGS